MSVLQDFTCLSLCVCVCLWCSVRLASVNRNGVAWPVQQRLKVFVLVHKALAVTPVWECEIHRFVFLPTLWLRRCHLH